MNAQELGIKLRRLRDDKKLTRMEVAKHFDFKGTKQIERWESGELYPSLDQLYALSTLYKVDLFRVLSEMMGQSAEQQAAPSLTDLAEMIEVLQSKVAAQSEYLSLVGSKVQRRKTGEIRIELDRKAASFFQDKQQKGKTYKADNDGK